MRERTFYASFFLAVIGAAWLAKVVGSSHVPESGYFAWIPVLLMLMFMGAPVLWPRHAQAFWKPGKGHATGERAPGRMLRRHMDMRIHNR
jgi:hypothetical protein